LHGIPIGIKDFYDTAGIKTTAGFEPFKQRVPATDAVVVKKLKEAGAIIIGKTNMHKLGMGTTGLESYFGPVHNPWNAEYIPGGSSSGSAAAVASGMCYATVDTDAIGSCRLPAACCGVTGFKGTYGLINPKGILEGEEDPCPTIRWLSHPGITARDVEDGLYSWTWWRRMSRTGPHDMLTQSGKTELSGSALQKMSDFNVRFPRLSQEQSIRLVDWVSARRAWSHLFALPRMTCQRSSPTEETSPARSSKKSIFCCCRQQPPRFQRWQIRSVIRRRYLRGTLYSPKWGSCLSTVTTTACGFVFGRESAKADSEWVA
jgi:hypothetical protein